MTAVPDWEDYETKAMRVKAESSTHGARIAKDTTAIVRSRRSRSTAKAATSPSPVAATAIGENSRVTSGAPPLPKATATTNRVAAPIARTSAASASHRRTGGIGAAGPDNR